MWCYLPDTASPSVQAAADLTWVLNLPSRALPPPAMSKSMNTPDRHSLPDNRPDTSNPPRSGTISSNSTAGHSEGSLIVSLPDTHASRFPKRDKEKVQPIRVTSGPTSPELPMKSDHLGSSLKMSQAMFRSVQKPFCGTYEEWVLFPRQACSQRLKQARRMSASAGSVWPTATATHSNSQTADTATPGQAGGTTLAGAAEKQWQTPVADDHVDLAKGKINSRGEPKLSAQSLNWSTPRSTDATKGSPNQAFGGGGVPLPAQAAAWPSPQARSATGPSYGQNGGADLQTAVETWPTPSAMQDTKGDTEKVAERAAKGKQLALAHIARTFTHPDHPTSLHGLPSSQWRPISRLLFRSATASVSQTTLRRWLRQGSWRKRRLNQLFVEWLMGWPSGHALLNCSETEFTHWKQHMRSALSAMPTGYAQWIWEPMEEVDDGQGELF